MRASLTPVVTLIGLDLGALLGGAVITETVFNLQGIGQWAVNSTFQGDLPAFFAYLRDEPRFYYTRGEDLVAGYREVKQRIDAQLPKLFSVFPHADYEVRELEPYRAAPASLTWVAGLAFP